MNKILIITGPTATGKTNFALEVAKKYQGELLSADSRQVYIGADIVTGKDIPANFSKVTSEIIWHDKPLTYYTDGTVRIWLTDIVNLDENFNVSFWKECCDLVINNVICRQKNPIVVGGTGLYIKSLTHKLTDISVPHDQKLRDDLSKYTVDQLFNYLKRIDASKAASLNVSDSKNPRRLIRAIEITKCNNNEFPSPKLGEGLRVRYLTIGLSSSRDYLSERIITRVNARLAAGAETEAKILLSKYPQDLQVITSCGYRAFLGEDPRQLWITSETQYLKRQVTWFTKIPGIAWFDICQSDWQTQAEKLVNSWYNSPSV